MRFSNYGGVVNNTCSIKLLKKAYIGLGVRMTSGKGTISFENKPMKGLEITDYNNQGFRIKHENLPKEIWVDFHQLPLTRLTIKNGIIEDEITFVENIVRHQMQLIRTLDTEYIDLLYKEKDLKEEKIIPLSEAIPGHIYKGAQCKDGIEMVYLGTWFGKDVISKYSWGSSLRKNKYFLSKTCPERAYFLIPDDNISPREELELMKKYPNMLKRHKLWNSNKWYKLGFKERNLSDQIIKNREEPLFNKDLKNFLENSSKKRYKIVVFSKTSKVVKKLISLNKEEELFYNKDYNKEIALINSQYFGYNDINIKLNQIESDEFEITGRTYSNVNFSNYLADTRKDVEENSRKFIAENYNLELEEKFYEEVYY
ncbi:MAG: hypothetical protein ACOC1K_06200 [Nanoarchaeota archaeon]